jgi:hypothetical protein
MNVNGKTAPALRSVANFGGNQRWDTRRYAPSSESELLDILSRHSGQTIRVLGSKHSWSDIAAGAAVSIDMRRLDRVELIERDGEPMVRVGAGCRLQGLLDWLHERTDRTLPTLGAIKKQTISGAISTGTHGSGRHSLSHYVVGIRAVVFDAPSGQPLIREFSQGPELEAARCGLGCMGVILAVELPTVPKYKIAETIRVRHSLGEIVGLYADQPLTQFFWTPYSWAWLTFERRPVEQPRLSSWDRVKAHVLRMVNLVFVDVFFHLFVIASRKTGLAGVKTFFRIVPHLMLKNRERIDDAEHVLTMEHDLFRHEEMELFVREADLARAMEVIRAAIEVCAGTATTVPAHVEAQLREAGTYDALLALRGSYVHHYVVFCRRVMPDDTLVSMAASAHQPYYSVSIFTYDRPERRQPFYELCGWLARTLLRLVDARLHWGKHFPLEYRDIARLYPRLAEFRAQCHIVDPAGVLRNGYTARVLDLPPGPAADARE